MRGLAKDVPEEEAHLFGDDLDARISIIKAAEKAQKELSKEDHPKTSWKKGSSSSPFKKTTIWWVKKCEDLL